MVFPIPALFQYLLFAMLRQSLLMI